MNNSFYNTSCDSNNDAFQSLKTCKFEIYLRQIYVLIEKGLHMDMLIKLALLKELLILEKCKRKPNYLKRCIHWVAGKRKMKERLRLSSRGHKERTQPYNLTDKHEVFFMMHIALQVMNSSLWYLDSGCSRHMTGDRSLFKTFEPKRGGNVTFGDGNKS